MPYLRRPGMAGQCCTMSPHVCVYAYVCIIHQTCDAYHNLGHLKWKQGSRPQKEPKWLRHWWSEPVVPFNIFDCTKVLAFKIFARGEKINDHIVRSATLWSFLYRISGEANIFVTLDGPGTVCWSLVR